MNKKLVLINTLIACVLSFSGVIAFKSGLFSGPVVEEVCIADVDATLDPETSPMVEALLNPRELSPLPPEQIDSETLWLARAIYSETKRPEEQVLVAWVIRNRVETGYRGKQTYKSVVLDPFQFSAFRPGSEKRDHYMSLTPGTRVPGWRTALAIAWAVRHMDDIYRPFSIDTRHFYSEQSMIRRSHPEWASDRAPVSIDYEHVEIDVRRFRFFDGIS